MQRLLAAVLVAFALIPSAARAQARDFHTQRVVLDDGNGNTTTIQTTGATNGTFTIPSNTPNPGDVITSTTSGGTTWQAPGGLPSGTVIMHTSSTAPSGYTLLSGPSSIAGGNAWVSEASVPTFRNSPMVASVNGKIYVMGGYSSSIVALSTMDVYDATSNSWSTDATTGTFTARAAGTAAVVGGKIYALCGEKNPGYSADNEVYDPVAKTWTTKTAVPGGGRTRASAFVSGNYIYVIGGANSNVNFVNNDVYDIANDSWNTTKTAASLTSVMSQATGAALNGKFYLLTPYVPDFRSFDPSTNAWSTLGVTGLTVRGSATLAAAGGKVYAIGGIVNVFPSSQIVSTTEGYDPSSGGWSAGISTGLTPQYNATSTVLNGTIYLICGQNNGALSFKLNESLIAGTSVYYYVKN